MPQIPASTDHDPSPPATNLLPSQVRQQEQQKYVTQQQPQLWQQAPQQHQQPQHVSQTQFVQPPVKQAHVRYVLWNGSAQSREYDISSW